MLAWRCRDTAGASCSTARLAPSVVDRVVVESCGRRNDIFDDNRLLVEGRWDFCDASLDKKFRPAIHIYCAFQSTASLVSSLLYTQCLKERRKPRGFCLDVFEIPLCSLLFHDLMPGTLLESTALHTTLKCSSARCRGVQILGDFKSFNFPEFYGSFFDAAHSACFAPTSVVAIVRCFCSLLPS